MKPPPDRLLDLRGTGTDVPAFNRAPYGVRGAHIFTVATALALLSTTLAWQFTRSSASRRRPSARWSS